MSKEILDSLKEKISKLEFELGSIKSELNQLLKKEKTNLSNSNETNQEKTSFTIQRPTGTLEVEKKDSTKSKLDFEMLLGGNILGKLGIFAIILAISWFIKYAFDNELINESVRIFLGLNIGFVFISWGLFLTASKMKILPESLIGAGTAILYISIYSGFYFYNFFGINETFFYLFFLSVSISLLAGFVNSETLYGFSLIGLILSPMLLSSGENSYRFLFTYLTIINLIYLFISTKNVWRVAPYLLALSNVILYSGWDLNNHTEYNFYYSLTYLSITCFIFSFKEFYITPKLCLDFSKSSMVLFILVFLYFIGYFSSIVYIKLTFLNSIQNLYFIGILFGLNYFFEKRIESSQIKEFILPRSIFIIFILLLFLSSLSVFFNGNNLSLSLIVFASFISLVAIQSKSQIYLVGSLVIWLIILLRLFLFNWSFSEHQFIILNSRFLTYFSCSISLLFLYRLQKKEFPTKFTNIFIYSSILVLIFGSLVEVNYFVHNRSYRNLGYTYTILFYAIVFLFFGFKNNYVSFRRMGLLLSSILILKFYLYDIWNLSVLVRIVAGLTLGLSLIILNTVYQKFKDKISMDKILKIFILFSLSSYFFTQNGIYAESFKSSSYKFHSNIELNSNPNESIQIGKFIISEEISKYHGINDLRLVYKEKLVPYYIKQSTSQTEQIKEIKPKVVFDKVKENTRTYVLKLESIPKNFEYFELEFTNTENYESNVQVSLGETVENFEDSFLVKVFKYSDTESAGKIPFSPGKYKYIKLFFDTKSEFDFLFARYKKVSENLEYSTNVEIGSLKKNQDSDRYGTNYYYSNEDQKPISRIELNFTDEKFNRSLEIYEKKPETKKFEMIGSSFLIRKNGKESFSVNLSSYSGGELKFLIINQDDKELNLSELKFHSRVYEIQFKIPTEFEKTESIDLYYGNKYAFIPRFDFIDTLNEEKKDILEFKIGKHSENPNYTLSIIEPPISTWILRIIFLVGFIGFLIPMYKLLKKYNDSFKD